LELLKQRFLQARRRPNNSIKALIDSLCMLLYFCTSHTQLFDSHFLTDTAKVYNKIFGNCEISYFFTIESCKANSIKAPETKFLPPVAVTFAQHQPYKTTQNTEHRDTLLAQC